MRNPTNKQKIWKNQEESKINQIPIKTAIPLILLYYEEGKE
jgi:hypothetical protein